MKRRISVIVLMGMLAACLGATRITVDADKPGIKVSPTLYGIFFEDINYGADGGVYAEMVQNRSVEFREPDGLFAWSKVERGSGKVELGRMDFRPLNGNNLHYLRLHVKEPGGGAGIANSGWDGMAIRAGVSPLRFSVYARSMEAWDGTLKVAVEAADGRVLGTATIGGIAQEWTKYTAEIVTSGEDANARLVILADRPGAVDLDMVSLFPANTFKGRANGMRADLVQMLADLKPAFMRFPGGCIVEGRDWGNAYRWKDTVGDVAERKINWNRWQDAMKNATAPQYYQSYGLGFFEFFQLCEDIGAEPLPIINCGMTCQYEKPKLMPVKELGPFIQDALDLIEFANGPASSKWGGLRAKMGHAEPFHMKFMGVGNEQWGNEYFERLAPIQAAIKAKYPEMKLVVSAGPSSDGKQFDLAWNWIKSHQADLVDEHFYRAPDWFLKSVNRYDRYDRKGAKVFAGEYAAHRGDRKCSIEPALAEAAFLTGVERNSDVVAMASYAPLFAKVGHVQWNVDLIWFDNARAFGTPSYYVQQMFGRNRGDVVVPAEVQEEGSKGVYAVAGLNEKGDEVILKVVNVQGSPADARIMLRGVKKVGASATAIVMAGRNAEDMNSLERPRNVAPVTGTIGGVGPEFSHTFPAYSVTVMRIGSK